MNGKLASHDPLPIRGVPPCTSGGRRRGKRRRSPDGADRRTMVPRSGGVRARVPTSRARSGSPAGTRTRPACVRCSGGNSSSVSQACVGAPSLRNPRAAVMAGGGTMGRELSTHGPGVKPTRACGNFSVPPSADSPKTRPPPPSAGHSRIQEAPANRAVKTNQKR